MSSHVESRQSPLPRESEMSVAKGWAPASAIRSGSSPSYREVKAPSYSARQVDQSLTCRLMSWICVKNGLIVESGDCIKIRILILNQIQWKKMKGVFFSFSCFRKMNLCALCRYCPPVVADFSHPRHDYSSYSWRGGCNSKSKKQNKAKNSWRIFCFNLFLTNNVFFWEPFTLNR